MLRPLPQLLDCEVAKLLLLNHLICISTSHLSGKGGRQSARSINPFLALFSVPCLQNPPSLCVPGAECPRQGQWWPADCGCPGTLWPGHLRPGLCFSPCCYCCETSMFTWTNLYPVCYQKQLQSELQFLASTMTVNKPTKIFSLFYGKILVFKKRSKGQHWKKEENYFNFW